MKIILLKDHSGLGEEGDILTVKDGFGRNFLLPKKIAVLHNPQNLSILEGKKHKIEEMKKQKKAGAVSSKSKIESLILEFSMEASEVGKLYGSLSAQSIVDELKKHDVTITRKSVEIPKNHIRTIGDYKIKIKLYGLDPVDLKVKITPKHAQKEEAKEETKEESKETNTENNSKE